MKDNIQIGLLTLIAGMLVYQIATRNTGATTPVPAPTAMTAPAANPFAQPAKSTFDPATPPATPITSNAPRTAVKFAKDEYDFGKVISTSENTYKFAFTNTGSEPLIIENAQGSCGCTVPKCDTAPIKPGQSTLVTVKYDTKRVGPINKSVTISSNAANAPEKIVRISGTIEPGPETPASPVKEQSPMAPVEQN